MAYNQDINSQRPLSGASVNISASVASTGFFSLSSVANAVGATTTYTGAFGNAQFAGTEVDVLLFSHPANNGQFMVVSNTSTTMTVLNSAGIAETASAFALPTVSTWVLTASTPVPAALQVPGAGVKVVTSSFTTSPSTNNGTFIVVGANSGFITVNNAAGTTTSAQSANLLVSNTLFTPAGVNVLRGSGQGLYSKRGIGHPVLATSSSNPGSIHQAWLLEGDTTDAAGIEVFQHPDGIHGLELWSVYDSTGLNPSSLVLGFESGPFISLQLPDEATGLTVQGTHVIPISGDTSTITLFALSDAVTAPSTPNTGSSLVVVGTTAATGDAKITIDNVNGITVDNHGGGGITLNQAGTAGGINLTTGLGTGGITLTNNTSSLTSINDNGTGILLLARGGTAGINITSQGNQGVQLQNTGTGGGIAIGDSSGGPIFISGNGQTYLLNQGAEATFIHDDGGGGIFIVGADNISSPHNTITSVANAVGPITTYTGTFPSNFAVLPSGQWMIITGFTNPSNNGTFRVQSASSSSLVLFNAGGVAETASASWQVTSQITMSNAGAGGTVITDGGVGGLTLSATNASGSINIAASIIGFSGHVTGNGTDVRDFTGVVTVTSSTTGSITFANSFTTTNAPVVVVTPTSDPTTAGVYWVTATGTAGAWTGFTVHIANSTTISFNYIVIGNG